MAYIKTNWTAGAVIDSTKMNHRETQYDEAKVDIDAHTGAASGAHAASAISVADAGAIFTSADVEGALQELYLICK